MLYQLAKPSDVTLPIYASNGQVVRRVALGHQPAGMYQNSSRAAYWEGRWTERNPAHIKVSESANTHLHRPDAACEFV